MPQYPISFQTLDTNQVSQNQGKALSQILKLENDVYAQTIKQILTKPYHHCDTWSLSMWMHSLSHVTA